MPIYGDGFKFVVARDAADARTQLGQMPFFEPLDVTEGLKALCEERLGFWSERADRPIMSAIIATQVRRIAELKEDQSKLLASVDALEKTVKHLTLERQVDVTIDPITIATEVRDHLRADPKASLARGVVPGVSDLEKARAILAEEWPKGTPTADITARIAREVSDPPSWSKDIRRIGIQAARQELKRPPGHSLTVAVSALKVPTPSTSLAASTSGYGGFAWRHRQDVLDYLIQAMAQGLGRPEIVAHVNGMAGCGHLTTDQINAQIGDLRKKKLIRAFGAEPSLPPSPPVPPAPLAARTEAVATPPRMGVGQLPPAPPPVAEVKSEPKTAADMSPLTKQYGSYIEKLHAKGMSFDDIKRQLNKQLPREFDRAEVAMVVQELGL